MNSTCETDHKGSHDADFPLFADDNSSLEDATDTAKGVDSQLLRERVVKLVSTGLLPIDVLLAETRRDEREQQASNAVSSIWDRNAL